MQSDQMVPDIKERRPGRKKQYVANLKPGGKMHRLMASTTNKRIEYRRTICGWKAGGATAKAQFCFKILSGRLCLKCFPDTDKPETPVQWQQCTDAIEYFD